MLLATLFLLSELNPPAITMALFLSLCLVFFSIVCSSASATLPPYLDGKWPSLGVWFSGFGFGSLVLMFDGVCLCRASSKWGLWERAQGVKSEEDSDKREALTPGLGDQGLGGVCFRWAAARWVLPGCSSWGTCSEAWEWGFDLSECSSEAWLHLLAHLWGH